MKTNIPGYTVSIDLEAWKPDKKTMGEMTIDELFDELRKADNNDLRSDLVKVYIDMSFPDAKETHPEYFI